MRIVEPGKKPTVANRERPKRVKSYKKFVWLAIIFIAAFVGYRVAGANDNSDQIVQIQPQNNVVITNTESVDTSTDKFRQFSGNEFRLLYDQLLQPNLDKVDIPPAITGNDVADTRIRQLAESRGYRLRSSPTKSLVMIDGIPLQDSIDTPWKQLKAEALSNGLTISITSGYRSVESQKQLFLSRLAAEGISVAEVVNGTADAQVNTVLITTAVPGYSKHHTGYTMDLLCRGFAFENFKDSTCHTWMSANNYEKVKQYGFIPSYPADSDLQGPDPEAWEYVYVGTEVLYQ